MFKNINKIIEILDNKKKKEFKILILLMFFAMLLETIGISSMIPLINYFTNENILSSHNINLNQLLLEFGIPKKNINLLSIKTSFKNQTAKGIFKNAPI